MLRRLFPIALILVAGCPPKQVAAPPPSTPAATAPTPSPSAPVAAPVRLPRTFVPTSYRAVLAIDPGADQLAGSITIEGTIDKPTTQVWLHGYKLDLGRVRASREGRDVELQVKRHGEDVLELVAPAPLDAGAWTVAIDYRAPFEAVATAGAFKQVVDGKPYVYTQLEAVYARRVFPCLDEPDIKVPWQLTLEVPAGLVAVSNTPVVRESALDDRTKRVQFARTKAMPSYLVAFGVGPFEIVDAGASKRGTPVRIVTLAGRKAETAYAAKVSAKLLDIAEAWFGTPYPYEKLDMLTIPLTVGFGAMENAGLITFTESLMLLGPGAGQVREHRYAIVAAHEIAHQWFGNLVTMVFWDDIWLNEGFANWVETKLSAALEPAWREPESVLSVRDGALGADALVSARQIRQPIATADDILTAFDGITYNKGASVLAMFERYVGADVFQRGVREYLASRAWGNATSTDFATAIATAAGEPRLVDAFASFLDQPGAPELSTTVRCDGSPRVDITQRRYVPAGAPTATAARPWILPVCVAYDKDGARGETCALVDKPSMSIALPTKVCPRWVMPNVDGAGYFRVAYTPAQLTAVRDIAWPQLAWTERRAVAFDAQELASNARLPLALALSLSPRLLAASDRFTVPRALALATSLDELVPDALRTKYEYYLQQTFGPGAAAVGLVGKSSDSIDTEVMRSSLIGTLAWTARDPKLVEQAVSLAARWRDLPHAIRSTVLSVAVDASPDVFDRILREAPSERDRVRRREMLTALASVRDVARQSRALALVISPDVDIRESMWMLFGGSRADTRANAQAFYRTHRDSILARLPKDGTTDSVAELAAIFTASCDATTRDAVAAYVTSEFSRFGGGPRTVAQAIEAMDQCIARKRLLAPEIDAWLGGLRLPKKS